MIIAVNKDKIIGVLSFEEYPWTIEIDTLIVDIKYRNKGMGSKLIKYFINKIKKTKYQEIRVGTYKCYDCKGFYLSNGFEIDNSVDSKDTWEFIMRISR